MVAEKSIYDLCDRIVQEFQPERIILFGSYASGAPTPDSDVDLLVLLPFTGKSFRVSLEILNRTNPPLSHRSPGTDPGGYGTALSGRRSPDS